MKALFFEGEIRDRESAKDVLPGTPISGFDVYTSGFVRAFLEHSRRDVLLLTEEAYRLSFGRDVPAWLAALRGRIACVNQNASHAWSAYEDLILMSVGPELLTLAWMRYGMSLARAPIVAVLHSMAPAPRVRYLLTNKMLALLDGGDALICGSQVVKETLERMHSAIPPIMRATEKLPFSTPLIPFGIDTDQFRQLSREDARRRLGLSQEQTIILSFGKISPADRADPLPLLIAYSRLSREQDSLLIIAGDDTSFRMGSALTAAAAQRGCAARVKVISDPSSSMKCDLLSSADIFVALGDNLQEGFSLSLAEAMSAGLAVIATDWGGHRECIADGISGLLVRTALSPLGECLPLLTAYSGPSVEQRLSASTAVDLGGLTRALKALIESPEMRRRLGENARMYAQSSCSWPKVMARYDDLWDELAAEKQSACQSAPPRELLCLNEVFERYASPRPPGTPTLTMACQEKEQQELLAALGRDPRFDRELLVRLAATIRQAGSPVDENALVQQESSIGGPNTPVVQTHVARLVKYGVLERAYAANEVQ